jgi:hypothetical protein
MPVEPCGYFSYSFRYTPIAGHGRDFLNPLIYGGVPRYSLRGSAPANTTGDRVRHRRWRGERRVSASALLVDDISEGLNLGEPPPQRFGSGIRR